MEGLEIEFIASDIEIGKEFRTFVIAKLNGASVGTCLMSQVESDHPAIGPVTVLPDFRRIGIGTFMVKACINRMSGLGKRAMYLTTEKTNIDAIRLYRRLGFRSFIESEKQLWMGIAFEQTA